MATFPEPPDRRALVERVFAQGNFNLQTKQGCGEFTEACLVALDAADPGEWKHLKKSGGQNQWKGHAVDGGVHAPTGYFVDMIGSSESPDAEPTWHLDRVKETGGGPRYKGRTDLFLPAKLDGGAPQDPPTEDEDDELLMRIATLEGRIVALEQDVAAKGAVIMSLEQRAVGFASELQALRDRVQQLEDRPAPEPALPELVAEGSTGSMWGHRHTVRLNVSRK